MIQMKMKKITLPILVMIVFLGLGSLAYAEEGTSANTSTDVSGSVNRNTNTGKPGILNAIKAGIKSKFETRQEIKDTRQENRQEIKDMKEKMASTTGLMRQDIMKKRVANHFEIMHIRIKATIEREEAILARIVSRIEKIKVAGGNTTEAEKAVSDAKAKIAEAKSLLENLKQADGAINIDITSSTTGAKQIIMGLRKIAQNIEKDLREAHKLMMKTVGLLRGMSQLRPDGHTRSTNTEASTTTSGEVNTQI